MSVNEMGKYSLHINSATVPALVYNCLRKIGLGLAAGHFISYVSVVDCVI